MPIVYCGWWVDGEGARARAVDESREAGTEAEKGRSEKAGAGVRSVVREAVLEESWSHFSSTHESTGRCAVTSGQGATK